MKWIHYFTTSQIPFSIYKLNQGDAIINNKTQSTSMIILYGLVYVVKIFTNKEASSLAILQTNHIFHKMSTNKDNTIYYYKIIALKNTFLINFNWHDVINQSSELHKYLLLEIIQAYQQTIAQYEIMNDILIHQYIQNRIIQFILILSEKFGRIGKQKITIPFIISQKTIGIIIGSNRITVNRVFRKLHDKNLISYSYNKYIQIKNPLALSYFISNKEYT